MTCPASGGAPCSRRHESAEGMRIEASFADRKAAFRFVAELRRLYDIASWPSVEVCGNAGGASVTIDCPGWAADAVIDLVVRFHGEATLPDEANGKARIRRNAPGGDGRPSGDGGPSIARAQPRMPPVMLTAGHRAGR